MLRSVTRELQAQRARSAVRANFASVRTWMRETVAQVGKTATEWDAYRTARMRRGKRFTDVRFDMIVRLYRAPRTASGNRQFRVEFDMWLKDYPDNCAQLTLIAPNAAALKRVLKLVESRVSEIAATFQMTRSKTNPVWNTQLLRQNTIAAHPTMLVEETIDSSGIHYLERSMNVGAWSWNVLTVCDADKPNNLRKLRWATDALTRMMLSVM
jgi:hypothetical protein